MTNIAIQISWISLCGLVRVPLWLGFNKYQSDLSLWWQSWTSLFSDSHTHYLKFNPQREGWIRIVWFICLLNNYWHVVKSRTTSLQLYQRCLQRCVYKLGVNGGHDFLFSWANRRNHSGLQLRSKNHSFNYKIAGYWCLRISSKSTFSCAELTVFLSGEKHVMISSVLPVLHKLKHKILIVQ